MHPRHDDPTAELLREREARSLILLWRISLACFLVWTVYMTVLYFIRPQGHIDPARASLFVAINVGLHVLLLAIVRRRRWVEAAGIITALGCATFTAVTGYMMWRIFVWTTPAALLSKFPMAAAGVTVIAFMTLTLRPLHVVIVGVGVVVTLIGFFGLAALDSGAILTASSVEHNPEAISTTRLIVEVVLVAGATAGAAAATAFARRTVVEAVALQRSTDQLSRYFSPEIATGIRGGGEAFQQPGGREQDVVVLFSDLEGFTRICAGMPATEALQMLSAYHERMVSEIFRAGGTLDKFMGDGIMATFGTPTPVTDAADRAVRAARGMVAALSQLNRERAERGQPPLVQRIGIHAGPAVVGNVGTRQRLEFTVVGNTVNVASRVESACRHTRKSAMISAAVVERLSEPGELERIGAVTLDGQPEPVELYALA